MTDSEVQNAATPEEAQTPAPEAAPAEENRPAAEVAATAAQPPPPEPEPEAKAEGEPQVAKAAGAEAAPEVEAKPEPEPEAEGESQEEPREESEEESEGAAQADSEEGEAKSEPEPEGEEESEDEPEAEEEPEAQADSGEAEEQPEAEGEVDEESEGEEGAEAQAGSEGEAKPEAKAEAEAEGEPAAEESPEKKELEEVEAATIEAASEDEEQDTPFEKLVSRARRFSAERVRTILESLLFVTDKPLSEEALQQATGISVPVIKEQLQKLQGHYRDGVRGIVLHEVSGGWQFRTCPSTSDFVRRFLKVKPQRLTRAALETLAIIAYRQPVTRPEIEDIRAVDCGAVVKALLDRQLIKIIGKKEEPGRPLLYGTTPQFLEFFNLRDLSSLPTLREFQELNEESQQIVEQQTAGQPEEKKGTDGLVADLRDSKLEEKLKASTAEADDALADLETAIADTDSRTKATARILNPAAPVPPGGEAPVPGSPPGPVADGAEAAEGAGPSFEPEGGGEGAPAPEPEEPEEDEGGAADDEVPDELDDDDE